MKHRFRFIGHKTGSDVWLVEGEEHQHLSKVLRLPEGSEIEVTDGKGWACEGVVTSLTRTSTTIQEVKAWFQPPPSPQIHLCLGVLKASDMADLVPRLVETGCDRLTALGQQMVAKDRLNCKTIERWDRMAIQALKQCKRNWAMTIESFDTVKEFLAQERLPAQNLLLKPGAKKLFAAFDSSDRAKTPIRIAIGGEKGFSPEEEENFEAQGFAPASLGHRIYRASTTALLATGLLDLQRSKE